MIPDSAQPVGATRTDEDIMRVERGATPDGRLLLYFTFEPSTPSHAGQENGARHDRASEQSNSGGER